MTNVFEKQTTPAADEVGIDSLVGDGKKYATPDLLAKSYAEIEKFAETLKRENAELRAKADTSKNYEELAELAASKRSQQTPQGAPPSTNKPGMQPSEEPKFDEAIIDKRLDALLSQREGARIAEQNLRTVSDALVKKFGSFEAAQTALIEKAKELQISVEELQQDAMRSPAKVQALFGVNAEPAPRSAILAGTPGRTPPVAQGAPTSIDGHNTEAYYKTLPRDEFLSANVQRRMMADAKALGQRFFNR